MELTQQSSEQLKPGWIIIGWAFFVFALVGLVLPVIPQVPFAIAAAFCFSKGHPRLHRWMRAHKTMGPPIRDWEDHRVVRPKLKWISSAALVVGAGCSVYFLREQAQWLRITVPVIMLACIAFVLAQKSRP